ncbi:MAG: hypothetical protein MI723_07400 [Caulobacterales bacterium]|nr:hypothetical protein [Caulobacterales bacterium]
MRAALSAFAALMASGAPALAEEAETGDKELAFTSEHADHFAASWMGEWRGEGSFFNMAVGSLTPDAHDVVVTEAPNGIALVTRSDVPPFVVRYDDGAFEYEFSAADGSVRSSREEVVAFVVSEDGAHWAFISQREGMGPGGVATMYEELQAFSGDVITRRVKAFPVAAETGDGGEGGEGRLTLKTRYERQEE